MQIRTGSAQTHQSRNARVFGSVLCGQDTDSSDLDILIDPTPETTLMDVAAIQVELERLLGVSVDVLTPRALPDAFRSRVLSEAVPVCPGRCASRTTSVTSSRPSSVSTAIRQTWTRWHS
ncbi:hypothetical protein DBV39_10880 [Orrella marina]|uniref:Polymerase beta nucleotidyltransferase domain-containing protein n=1 Tax=Orrella marina TaxID=2163011 RepID=A0A2R4XK86_9BURK|nr:hypothetical protein DBV39_10880 [Orrella marina]